MRTRRRGGKRRFPRHFVVPGTPVMPGRLLARQLELIATGRPPRGQKSPGRAGVSLLRLLLLERFLLRELRQSEIKLPADQDKRGKGRWRGSVFF